MTRVPLWAVLFLAAPVCLAADLAAAQARGGDQAPLHEHLARIMAQEQPLADEDVRLYLENAEAIYRLRFEPEKMEETAAAISAWTPSRFAYVTAKMAASLGPLLLPDAQRGLAAPEFAKPTPAEYTVIRRAQDDLLRVMGSLQAKYASGGP